MNTGLDFNDCIDNLIKSGIYVKKYIYEEERKDLILCSDIFFTSPEDDIVYLSPLTFNWIGCNSFNRKIGNYEGKIKFSTNWIDWENNERQKFVTSVELDDLITLTNKKHELLILEKEREVKNVLTVNDENDNIDENYNQVIHDLIASKGKKKRHPCSLIVKDEILIAIDLVLKKKYEEEKGIILPIRDERSSVRLYKDVELLQTFQKDISELRQKLINDLLERDLEACKIIKPYSTMEPDPRGFRYPDVKRMVIDMFWSDTREPCTEQDVYDNWTDFEIVRNTFGTYLHTKARYIGPTDWKSEGILQEINLDLDPEDDVVPLGEDSEDSHDDPDEGDDDIYDQYLVEGLI
jgi:hypothetical protein